MSGAGIGIDRRQLIQRMKDAKEEAVVQYEKDVKKRKAEAIERHKKTIKEKTEELARLKADGPNPEREHYQNYYGSWNTRANTSENTYADQLKATLENIDKAIRTFEMGTEDTVRLGPRLIQDLGLGRYL